MSDTRPLSERAAEAISWQESGWLGRLGGDVADVTLAAKVDGHTLAELLDEREALLAVAEAAAALVALWDERTHDADELSASEDILRDALAVLNANPTGDDR